jgi:hypothetical protein
VIVLFVEPSQVEVVVARIRSAQIEQGGARTKRVTIKAAGRADGGWFGWGWFELEQHRTRPDHCDLKSVSQPVCASACASCVCVRQANQWRRLVLFDWIRRESGRRNGPCLCRCYRICLQPAAATGQITVLHAAACVWSGQVIRHVKRSKLL